MWKWHLTLFTILVVFSFIAVGYPHGDEKWFAWFVAAPTEANNQWVLLTVYRLPEVIIAIFSGIALSISGLLLQTLLNNPLAGPSILGLTSGSHLFVALALLGTGTFSEWTLDVSVTLASALGALFFGVVILVVAAKIRSTVSLLLVGMMLGTFVSALTSILMAKADANSVKSFTIWSFGSLQQVNLDQLPFIALLLAIGCVLAFLQTKPLNALVLGDNQAAVLGVNLKRTQWSVLLVVALLTGLITAFCGPIGFVGLIVPNMVKLFLKTANHRHLLLSSALLGAIVMVFCDWMIRVLEPIIVLPINSLTALLGAPIVVFFLVKKVRHA